MSAKFFNRLRGVALFLMVGPVVSLLVITGFGVDFGFRGWAFVLVTFVLGWLADGELEWWKARGGVEVVK